MEPSKKPLNVLIKSIGNNVTINLKGRGEYWGKMTRADGYMNLMLKGAKEYDDKGLIASYGDVFIRGNNILYICIDPLNPPQPKGPVIEEDEDDDE
ncbi:ribonucleoprotein [Candidatus Bathyarchaeota archaeon]|nr:ribonucleoprotein [Candidatus Bathyarchaeota archaeon]